MINILWWHKQNQKIINQNFTQTLTYFQVMCLCAMLFILPTQSLCIVVWKSISVKLKTKINSFCLSPLYEWSIQCSDLVTWRLKVLLWTSINKPLCCVWWLTLPDREGQFPLKLKSICVMMVHLNRVTYGWLLGRRRSPSRNQND